MRKEKLVSMSNEELLDLKRKRKSFYTRSSLFIGLLILFDLTYTYFNGLQLISFYSLYFFPLLISFRTNYYTIQKEIKVRKIT